MARHNRPGAQRRRLRARGTVAGLRKTSGALLTFVMASVYASFDAFLSYRHDDNDRVLARQLYAVLIESKLSVWMDEHCLQPGLSWIRLLQQGIESSQSGLVLIGSSGLGPWQNEEVEGLLQRAVQSQMPVIPVLLPGAPAQVIMPAFLRSRTWVDLRRGYTPEIVAEILWGVTGRRHKPEPLPAVAAPQTIREYIARRGHCIHKLKAKDTTGRWAYYFLLVEPDLESSFLRAIADDDAIIDLEHFGRIVASCYGEEPSEEVRRQLKKNYNFDV